MVAESEPVALAAQGYGAAEAGRTREVHRCKVLYSIVSIDLDPRPAAFAPKLELHIRLRSAKLSSADEHIRKTGAYCGLVFGWAAAATVFV